MRYSYVNDGAVRLVGYSRDELLTMTPLHLNPNATEADYRDLIETLLANPDHAVMHEAILVAKDGREIPVEKTFQSAPIGRGDARWVVILARNISERLAAERELRRSQDALARGRAGARAGRRPGAHRPRSPRHGDPAAVRRRACSSRPPRAAPTTAHRERLQATIDDLDETIKELRSAIFALQGSGPTPRGLRGRLVDVIAEAGAGLGFEPRIQFDGPIETMDERVATHLEAVLREAVTNVARHADATQRADLDLARRRPDRPGGDRRRQGCARRGGRRERPDQPGQSGRGARRHLRDRARARRRLPTRVAGPG